MLRETVKNTIKKYNLIESGDVVILGLSGGPDSVCLFDVLLDLSSEMDFKLHGAHVNHQFRPGAAEEDQLYVENLCEGNGICCWSTIVDCNALANELNIGSEEAGRKARYDFFAEITQSLMFEGIDKSKIKIAIAQNLNDQVETVLFRFLRGVGTDGLAGIDYRRINENGNVVIRPLLDVSKVDILQYCEDNNIEPCIDHTNSQPIYTRNKIRLNLIPELEEKYNSNLVESISRLSAIAKEDRDFIWSEVEKTFEKALVREEENEIWFNQEILQNASPSIRHRILFKAFAKVGLPKDIYSSNLGPADNLIMDGKTPQQVDFPRGYVIRVSYGNIICGLKPKTETGEKPPKIIINTLDIEQYEKKEGRAAFDLDLMETEYGRTNLQELIDIRTRISGDYMRLKGVMGRKKIQDLFVDMKIPSVDRDKIFMVGIGHEILWIPNGTYKGRYSGNYQISEDTKRVITVELSSFL